jgi:hypothetical protein
MQDSSVGLKQGLIMLVDLQSEPLLDFRWVQKFEVGATLLQRLPAAGNPSNIDGARRREDLVTAFVFELSPAPEGRLSQSYELRIRVGQLEDACVPVTGPAIVVEPELLEHDHTLSGSPKRFTGGQAHHACSDNDDLCVAHGPYSFSVCE